MNGKKTIPSPLTAEMRKRLLIIGASDSSGGAGIKADIDTLTAFGFEGSIAITSVTAQTNHKLICKYPVPNQILLDQLKASEGTLIDGIKIGLLPNRESINIVRKFLEKNPNTPSILDPVFSSSSKGELTNENTQTYLLEELLPFITLLTPNAIEASILTNKECKSLEEAKDSAQSLIEQGAKAVLVKGGHLTGAFSSNVLAQTSMPHECFEKPRIIHGSKCRGTGCRLATAICCLLSCQEKLSSACRKAGDFVHEYIKSELSKNQ